jgi:hypothetical protein
LGAKDLGSGATSVGIVCEGPFEGEERGFFWLLFWTACDFSGFAFWTLRVGVDGCWRFADLGTAVLALEFEDVAFEGVRGFGVFGLAVRFEVFVGCFCGVRLLILLFFFTDFLIGVGVGVEVGVLR